MDVSVRELRNHTARVIAAVEAGEPVVLTVHGRPVADIIPRRLRSERRPSELLLADLAAVSRLAAELEVASDATDFDVGLSAHDLFVWTQDDDFDVLAELMPALRVKRD